LRRDSEVLAALIALVDPGALRVLSACLVLAQLRGPGAARATASGGLGRDQGGRQSVWTPLRQREFPT